MAGSSKKRQFHVSAVDAEGDVHTFSTDVRERVEVIVKLMSEDLEQVEITDTALQPL